MTGSIRLADDFYARLRTGRTLIMGVLNTTPDSFSDGGRFVEPRRAAERGLQMIAEGADIVDVGGESTRPGADPVAIEEELRRVAPVVEALVQAGVAVSVDTRHAVVAAEGLRLGASILNDIAGLRDPRMRALAAEHNVPVVLMHMPVPDPKLMQHHAVYDDVVTEVTRFLAAQAALAEADGIVDVIIDPGFGFGKTLEHNVRLIRELDRIVALGYPVLVGASRKRTIGELTGVTSPADRVTGSVAMHLASVAKGARVVRVHDVAAHRQALDVWEAVEA